MLKAIDLHKVSFTLVRFMQYASSFDYIVNIFASLKCNNSERKTDQCERGLSIEQFNENEINNCIGVDKFCTLASSLSLSP